jgi:hypothetical protein
MIPIGAPPRTIVPMNFRHLASAAALVGFVLLAAGSKSAGPGSTCTSGQMKCTTGAEALYCEGGKFAAMKCAGPKGCVAASKGVDCDNTVASANDVCDEDQEHACAPDSKSRLLCKGHKFVVSSHCEGDKGCYWTGNTIHCDTDIADLNDPCDKDEDIACARDAKSNLTCKGGKYVTTASCRGAKGCRVKGTTVFCDHTVAELGDICESDELACAVDRKSLLHCSGGKYKAKQNCRGRGCTFVEGASKVTYECP